MNRVLEVAVPLAVTAGVGIGFYFFNKSDKKEEKRRNSQQSEKRRNSQPDLLSDLPGSGKGSEGHITPEEVEETKSEVLIQSDNGNSIASQFSVISDGDLDRNDLEEDQIDTGAVFPDEFQSLVFVSSEEGQGDSADVRKQGDLGASLTSHQSLTSQLSVLSIGSSVSDIEQIDDNNSSASGSRNGDRRTGGPGIIAQETGDTRSTEMLYVRETTAVSTQEASGSTEDILQSVSDLDEEETELYDILILHTEDDRDEVIEFSRDLKSHVDVDNLKVAIFEEFAPDIQSTFRTMTVVFERCRYLFVYVTENFTESDLERYQNEMALIDSITNEGKRERVIPVWTCSHGEKILPELGILVGLNYKRNEMDTTFKNAVERLIQHGRRKFLTS